MTSDHSDRAEPLLSIDQASDLHERFLNDLSATLVSAREEPIIVRLASRAIARHLRIDQVAVGSMTSDGTEVSTSIEHVTAGRSATTTYQLKGFLTDDARQDLLAGRPVVVADVMTDPRTAFAQSRFLGLGVGAMVTVPLLTDAGSRALLSVRTAAARHWREDEVQVLRSVTARVWPAVERARAEAVLRHREAGLRTVANTIPALVWVCSAGGDAILMNERWHEYTGQTVEEAKGLGWMAAMHPEDAARIQPYWERCHRTGEPYEGQVRYRRHDGDYRWHVFRAFPERGADGRIQTWYGCSVDLHEAKVAEQQVHQTAETLRAIFHTAGVGMANGDAATGRFLQVNAAYCAITGYSEVQLLGLTSRDITHPDDRDQDRDFFVRMARGEFASYEAEKRYVRPDGSIVWVQVNVNPIRDATGRVVRLAGVIQDITARKRADAALRTSEERLRLATRSAEIGVFDRDLVADRSLWSPELCALLGVPSGTTPTMAEFVGLIHPDDRARVTDTIAATLVPQGSQRSHSFTTEFRICRADTGETRWIVTQGEAFFEDAEEGRRAVRVSGVLTDITERKVREEHDQFVSELSASWMSARDVSTLVRVTVDAVTRHLHVNLVFLGAITSDASVATPDLEPTPAYVRLTAKGTYVVGDYLTEAARADLVAGRSVVVNDLNTDARTAFARDRYPAHVRAKVIVPLLSGGELKATLTVTTESARSWRRDEVRLLEHVAARLWPAVARARAEEALRRSDERQAFLLKLSDALRPLGDPIDMQRVAARLLGEHLQVNRVSYADIEGETFKIRQSYVNGGAPFVERGSVAGFGEVLLEAYRRGETVAVDDIRTDSRLTEAERAALLARGLAAFVAVSLLKGASWVGGVTVHSATPRVWTRAEVELTRDVAERTWEAVERAHAEAALREREQRLRLALEASAAGSWTRDADADRVDWDEGFRRLYGFPPDEPASFDAWLGRIHEEDRPKVLGLVDDMRHPTRDAWNTTFRIVRPYETVSWIQSLGRVERDSAGEVRRLAGLELDVTAQRRAEEALQARRDQERDRQAQEALVQSHATLQERTAELERRTVQLSRLASDLTLAEQRAREQLAKTLHDGLQQLLFSASLNLNRLLKDDAKGAAAAAGLLAQARHDVDEAMSAARSLSLELFPPVLHQGGLPVALTWLADWMRKKYGLAVYVTADPLADSDRKDIRTLLFESLRELLFNVVKHARVDRVAVDLALDPNDTLRITVTDEGIGFDPATVLNRAARRDAGLGLFSIRERLALLGGQLDIESVPGRGTEFRLIAPRSGAEGSIGPNLPVAAAPRSDSVIAEWPSRPLRILIVDDHAAVRGSLREMFDRPGLQVVGEASNGLEAIAQACALQPDVIVMDVSMPEMDGVEATRRIHAALPFIQIFGMSMQERTKDLHPIEQAGGAGYFMKGADMRHLIDRLLAVRPTSFGRPMTRPGGSMPGAEIVGT